jgi:hypothetical protein
MFWIALYLALGLQSWGAMVAANPAMYLPWNDDMPGWNFFMCLTLWPMVWWCAVLDAKDDLRGKLK